MDGVEVTDAAKHSGMAFFASKGHMGVSHRIYIMAIQKEIKNTRNMKIDIHFLKAPCGVFLQTHTLCIIQCFSAKHIAFILKA